MGSKITLAVRMTLVVVLAVGSFTFSIAIFGPVYGFVFFGNFTHLFGIQRPKSLVARTPLSRAAVRGNAAIVKQLLGREEVDVNDPDTGGDTPLLRAAEKGHESVVRLLLDKNVNIESQDIIGCTPLLRAVEAGHESIVRLLLENGANVESRDDDGPYTAIASHGFWL